MKYLFLLLFLPFSVLGAPFLNSDADPTGAADKCVYQDGTGPIVETPVGVTAPAIIGGCRIDLSTWTAGTHNLQLWFKSTVWGVTSVKVPFVLIKPAVSASGPTNPRVEP